MVLNPTLLNQIVQLMRVVFDFQNLKLTENATLKMINVVSKADTEIGLFYSIGSEGEPVNYCAIITPINDSNLNLHTSGLLAAQEIALDKKINEPKNVEWLNSVFEKWTGQEIGKQDKNGAELKPFDVFTEPSNDGETLNLVYYDKEENAFMALMEQEGGSFPLSDFDSGEIEVIDNLNNVSKLKYNANFPNLESVINQEAEQSKTCSTPPNCIKR